MFPRFAALCALLLITDCASQDGMFFDTTMQFDEGRPVQIDGRRGNGEWDDALQLSLSRGGHVLMKRHGDRLYLAVLTKSVRPVSVGILREDHLEITRASANLLTARYQREGELWRRATKFSTYKTSQGERPDDGLHLDRVGWVASTHAQPDAPIVEYCIDLPSAGLRIALAVQMNHSGRYSPHWPPGLTDGLLEPRLLEGIAPTMLDFEPEKWPLFLPQDPTEG